MQLLLFTIIIIIIIVVQFLLQLLAIDFHFLLLQQKLKSLLKEFTTPVISAKRKH